MLYVQQSLGPGEEILIGARFHWMYTLQALIWIAFGVAAAIAIGYGAIWWALSSDIKALYPKLPAHLYNHAWKDVVGRHGGYVKVLWSLHPLIRFAMLACFLIGVAFFMHMMVIRATTEIAVTNDRIVYKKGLIARHVGELAIDRIEGVSVDQELVGRLCGYGRICVRGMGVGEIILPPIASPIMFIKAIQEARAMKTRPAAVAAGKAMEGDIL